MGRPGRGGVGACAPAPAFLAAVADAVAGTGAGALVALSVERTKVAGADGLRVRGHEAVSWSSVRYGTGMVGHGAKVLTS